MTTSPPFELRRGSAADIDALEPLWISVHRHHAAGLPELAPYVSDAAAWAARRALYAELLGRPGTILALASIDGEIVGYGVAHVHRAKEIWVGDTWATAERIGEIESLGVLPEQRGAGIGSALLDELESALAAAGVVDLVIGVLAGNDAALRLYERRGFVTTWSYLSRFSGRGER